MSRQNYYQNRRQRRRQELDEELIVRLVRRERQVQPRLGGRKLLWLVGSELAAHGVAVGRDRFFQVLGAHGLLVAPKPGKMQTTQARHSLPVFGNLVAGLEVSAPHQVWVSDLTYIRTLEGYLFAAVIMDRYSRMIVGDHMGENLETAGCLAALDQALAGLAAERHPIHHSDRGCQYCSHLYVERLQARGLPISMTQELHCYENAAAERVIGSLKQEYELDQTFRTKAQASAAFVQAVYLYNHRRPHLALGYKFPVQVHAQAA